ncbi:hypothetical protein DUI87_00443 [Hirundo rustica rustica]|uniref:Uncharacterized protein n=1 Tax=Hirundo rustica rustica TaxID=333673 RepID=A0A3M0LC11_HIRRU|nr:hypothetical protein DUI87_00443 [Hirundo rustica rustica]
MSEIDIEVYIEVSIKDLEIKADIKKIFIGISNVDIAMSEIDIEVCIEVSIKDLEIKYQRLISMFLSFDIKISKIISKLHTTL